ncbi:hypothetical protein PMI07_002394 [Rhizobium sp. CF080]|uniref:hypothetical protein n=1 Tax=Rhizobium sp. (strain CF080) TaxID=1144310 RepID=UPI000271C61B|nr:hypothetical protein [Rhizobium sp. CF080]EUB95906.1 hypothetical protein PMI07_002394 [Rhizobium sp. CF080]
MSIALKKRKQLDQFMSRVMEPLSEGALTDFEYNRMLRDARRTAWHKAEATVRLHHARLEIHDAILLFDLVVSEQQLTSADEADHYRKRDRMLYRMKSATEDQIRTPAPDRAAIEWKRRRTADLYSTNRITREEIDDIVANDEAFLASHPVRQRKRVL